MELEERVSKAADHYLYLQGYQKLGEQNGFLVYEDLDGYLVFVKVSYSIRSTDFVEHDEPDIMQAFERAMIQWVRDNCEDEPEFPIRLDTISLNILSDDRALVRHHVNAFGGGGYGQGYGQDRTVGETDKGEQLGGE